jgi:hypothetical protein
MGVEISRLRIALHLTFSREEILENSILAHFVIKDTKQINNNSILYLFTWSLGSSVSIVSDYKLDDRDSNPARAKKKTFLPASVYIPAQRPAQPLILYDSQRKQG